MFQLSFDTDNAAFEGGALEYEVAAILREVASMVEGYAATGKFQPVRDTNGNQIGTWKLNREESR